MRRSIALALACSLAAAELSAQATAPPSPGLTGAVLEAETGTPIKGAVVVLERAGDAAIATETRGTSFFSRTLHAITSDDGMYRFAALSAGSYRIHVRHFGYQDAVVGVELPPGVPFEVSVGLVLAPIRLDPVMVHGVAAPFGRPRAPVDEMRFGTIEAEELRQSRFLSSDARVLTQSDLTQAVTLDEGDLLRAMQRLPGVSTRDDYNAGLWTRGSPWGQTRVYFDGLPLFNPVHGFGLVSGVSPDIIGIATFHPGVRSASVGEGAAGVLDLTSRIAEGAGVRGLTELSVTNLRGALEGSSQDGSRTFTLAARRSYIDWATQLASALGHDSTGPIPYDFFDLAGKTTLRLGTSTIADASGLWTQDHVNGDVSHYLRQTTGHWGTRLGRFGLSHAGATVTTRLGVGVSAFSGLIGPSYEGLYQSDTFPQHGLTNNEVQAIAAAAEIAPTRVSRGSVEWSAGFKLTHYHDSFRGQYPRPYPVALLPDILQLDRVLTVPAFWAEARRPFGSLTLQAGLRTEFPNAGRAMRGPAVAPRLLARYQVSAPLSLSAGYSRSWQYTQALAPAGPSVGPDLYLTDVWLLAGDTIPAIRSDVATLGLEFATPGGWIATATVFGRKETGVAVPDPQPGELTDRRKIFVPARNRARGLELNLRRVLGQWTTALSYTLSHSELEAGTWTYPSPSDRRHVVDATAMYRTASGIRLGGALTAASGAAFSRFILQPAPCDTLRLCSADSVAQRIELPGGARTASYASVDLLLDWDHAVGRARLGAFVQLRNVLGFSNAITYTGSIEACSASAPPKLIMVSPGVCDRFDRGLPLLPVAGVRLVF